MVPEHIKHLYRPQPVKPDKARARCQDVGEVMLDAVDRKPNGTSLFSKPIYLFPQQHFFYNWGVKDV